MSLRDPLSEKWHTNGEEESRDRTKVGRVPNSILFWPLPKSKLPPRSPLYTQMVEVVPNHDWTELRFVYGHVVIVVTGERLEALFNRFQETRLWMVEQIEDVRDAEGNLYVPEKKHGVLSINYEDVVG